MTIARTARSWLVLLIPLAVASPGPANGPSASRRAAAEPTVAAADAFLATLSDAERAKGTFGFTASQRTGWSNLPTGIFQRNGSGF